MKDYYYFLGIERDASPEDIKKAYRKLSLKYHPDKNADDEFFRNRFREIQEAYELLMDSDKRKMYDRNLFQHKQSFRSHFPPQIKSFHCNKMKVLKGDEIILKWITEHADVVKIIPVGLVKSHGEMRFSVPEFTEGKFQILLHAHNSLLKKTTVRSLTIFEGVQDEKNEESKSYEENTENEVIEPLTKQSTFITMLFGILLLVIVLTLYLIFRY